MKTTKLRSIAHNKNYALLALIGILLINYMLIGRVNTCLNYMSDNETLVINEVTNNVVDVSDVKKVSLTSIKKKNRKIKKSNIVVSQNKLSGNKTKKNAGVYDTAKGNEIVEYALRFQGLRYVYGGNSLTTGTDCSGFVKLIYAHFGYKLKRGARGQLSNGRAVSKSELKPGDLVFYNSDGGSKVSHVAIYIGNGKIIHESTPKSGCVVASVNCMHYVTARRIINDIVTTTAQTVNNNNDETTTTVISSTITPTTTTETTTTTTVPIKE